MIYNGKLVLAIDEEHLLDNRDSFDYKALKYLLGYLIKDAAIIYSNLEFDKIEYLDKYKDFVFKKEESYTMYQLPQEMSRLIELYVDCCDFHLFSQKGKVLDDISIFEVSYWDTEMFMKSKSVSIGLYTSDMDDYLLFESKHQEQLKEVNTYITFLDSQ
jgi:hypothetical protein